MAGACMGLFAKETLELEVTGMTCGNCVGHVTKALEGVAGVKKVSVDLEGSATVTVKEGTSRETLIAAIKSAGYDAS